MLPSTLLTASHYHRKKEVSLSETAYRTLKEKIITLELMARQQDIITAIKTRDGERAAQIMRAHVAGFRTQFTSLL